MIHHSHGFRADSLVWSVATRLLHAAQVVTLGIYLAQLLLSPSKAAGREVRYIVKPIAEMKVKQLPKGPLYWRIENFPTLERANTAAGEYRWNPDTVSYEGLPSLSAEAAGKVWLFTLGPQGGATPGGTKAAEIGPVPPFSASEYLLRVSLGSGPLEAKTPVHSHPGSESFYVIAGKLGQRTPNGVSYVEAGHTMKGRTGGMPMQVFNGGTTELTALMMFVVDASRPFSVLSDELLAVPKTSQ
jgi:hypothetical protein